MANTYVAIATTTVGSGGAANIDFQNIPSTYTDLILLMAAKSAYTGSWNDVIKMTFNNNTSSNYLRREIEGDGSTVASYSETTTSGFQYIYVTASGTGAGTVNFGNCSIYIPNYAGSSNKSFSVDNIQERNSSLTYMCLMSGLWENTAAINRITLTSQNSSNFSQYSTATLYGIKNS